MVICLSVLSARRKARAVTHLRGDGACFHIHGIIYRGMVYAKMFYGGWCCFLGGWHPPSTRILAERTNIQHSHNFSVVFIALFAIFYCFLHYYVRHTYCMFVFAQELLHSPVL